MYLIYCFCDSRGGMLFRPPPYDDLNYACRKADEIAGQRKTLVVIQDKFGNIVYQVDRR